MSKRKTGPSVTSGWFMPRPLHGDGPYHARNHVGSCTPSPRNRSGPISIIRGWTHSCLYVQLALEPTARRVVQRHRLIVVSSWLAVKAGRGCVRQRRFLRKPQPWNTSIQSLSVASTPTPAARANSAANMTRNSASAALPTRWWRPTGSTPLPHTWPRTDMCGIEWWSCGRWHREGRSPRPNPQSGVSRPEISAQLSACSTVLMK